MYTQLHPQVHIQFSLPTLKHRVPATEPKHSHHMFLLTNTPQHPLLSSGLFSKMSLRHHFALPWHLVFFQYTEGFHSFLSYFTATPFKRPANSVKVFFCVIYPSLFHSSSKRKTINSSGKL